MLVENRNAVVYGGGGSMGGAAARALASEGARVFLVGRTPAKLEAGARAIADAGVPRTRPKSTSTIARRWRSTPTA